jgi:hypothetical protein
MTSEQHKRCLFYLWTSNFRVRSSFARHCTILTEHLFRSITITCRGAISGLGTAYDIKAAPFKPRAGRDTHRLCIFPQLEEAAPFDASQAEFTEFLSADALQNIPEEMDETQLTDTAGQLETLRQRADQLRTKNLAAN